MRFPTSGHLMCPFNLCKLENSWVLVTVSPKVVPPPKSIVSLPKLSPLRYPATTSKGGQGRDRVTTSKGGFKQQTPVISKKTQVSANFKGDQEPIATRTRSRIASSANLPPFKAIHPLSEPVAARTRPSTLSHNYTTLSHSRALAAQILTHVA